MDEKIDKNKIENLVSLELARIKRLMAKGHYMSLVEEYEKLRLKLYYESDKMNRLEVIRFITLLKFLKDNGHSESFKLSCKYMYKKYFESFGL